jgi:hypothetical protein
MAKWYPVFCMPYTIRCALLLLGAIQLSFAAKVHNARPSNVRALLGGLKPGDTLSLAPGRYPPLLIRHINGTPEAWITIRGASDGEAVIEGSGASNVIEIESSSYLSIENLHIDSRGIEGAFGINAGNGAGGPTHDIRIEGNTFTGQNGSQQTDAISTKTPTWGWIVRYNRVLGAGTGMYLGNSDGGQPFVAGLIEHNLFQNTIGYNIEIKHQISLPAIPGMPLGPTSTIIRDNVFIKDDRPSPDGDRPNLLVDPFPATGPGSLNLYEIYGNYFRHNHRESLFQGAGRFTLHDNIFVDGPYSSPAVVIEPHNGPVKLALIYNNTIYTPGPGIQFFSQSLSGDSVVGNVIFATVPLAGPITEQAENITGSPERAPLYLRAPSFEASADFYPLPGKCQGAPVDLSGFHSHADYTVDFNGISKVRTKGAPVFRGAYAGEGENPGWLLQADVKPPPPPVRAAAPQLVAISPANARVGKKVSVTLTGAGFTREMKLTISGEGVDATNLTYNNDTELTATFTIAAGAKSGTRDVTVSGGPAPSNAMKFRVSADAVAK